MWETRDDKILKGRVLLIIPKNQSQVNINKNFFREPEINKTIINYLNFLN